MDMPVDIKAVLDAMRDADDARNQPVSVHVYLDDSAPRDLVNVALAATRSVAANAEVLHDAFPPVNAIPDASADLALLVSVDGSATGELYHALQGVGVPTVVFTDDARSLVERSVSAGKALAESDVIAPDPEIDPTTLPDRTTGSPLALDSSDAAAMLGAFGTWVVGVFKDKRLAFAHAFPCVRRPLALESVNSTAVQNAGIGVVALIPGADLPLMTLNQVKMLLEIAAAYGEELSFGRLKEIAAIVGGAFACRGVARQVIGILPGIGWVVKGGIGYAGTLGMGHALLAYFEQGADAAAVAQQAAASMKATPAWLGMSPEKGLAGNVRQAAGAAREAAVNTVGKASRNIGPTVASVAAAAGEATGFTRDDIAEFAGRAASSVREKLGRGAR